MALVPRRLPGWCALCAAVAVPGIGFPGPAAGSGRELYCKLQAQRAAFRRLRRSPTCRVGTLSSRPDRVRAGGEIALRRRRSLRLPLVGFQRCPSVGINPPRPVPARSSCDGFAFGPRDATLSGAFRPCRSSRLRRFAPRCVAQGLRSWGPRSTRVEPAPIGVSPATDPGVHAVSAPAALSADSRSAPVPFGIGAARRRDQRAALAGASPVMPYPSKRVPSSAAVPSSPMGDAFSPVHVAADGQRCRYELHSRVPLRHAGLKALLRCRRSGAGCCRQRSCPDASLGLVLERTGGRCFRGFCAGEPRSRAAIGVGARVEPVCTRSLDRDPTSKMGRAGPRLIRRILWESASPGRTSPPRSGGAGRVGSALAAWRRRAAPRPACCEAACCGRDGPKFAFSFP